MTKKKRAFALSPLRALMKAQGADLVAKDAINVLLADLEKRASELTKSALSFAKHADRKKITKEDILKAIDTPPGKPTNPPPPPPPPSKS